MNQQKTVVVAFGFGDPATTDVYRDIALWALRASYGLLGAVVVTHSDVMDKFDRFNEQICLVPNDQRGAPTTLRLARRAVEVAKEIGAKQILVCCVLPHAARCFRDIGQAKLEMGVNAHSSIAPGNESYSAESAWYWWLQELIRTAVPFWIYSKWAS